MIILKVSDVFTRDEVIYLEIRRVAPCGSGDDFYGNLGLRKWEYVLERRGLIGGFGKPFKLLEKYGGWWLDSDCVLYKDINHIHRQLIDSEKDFHNQVGKLEVNKFK